MKDRTSSSKQPRCANPHCRRREIRARGRCQACYVFLRRHGRDATPSEMRPQRRRVSKKRCMTCRQRPVYARKRCRRCYQYWMRTGRERLVEGQKGRGGLCLNCGKRPVYQLGRCRSCHAYLRMYGKDRAGIRP